MQSKVKINKYAKKTPGPKGGCQNTPVDTARRKKAFLRLYDKLQTNTTETCKALHMSRKTYYRWIDDDPVFAEEIQAIKEGVIDWSEGKLRALIDGGDTASTIFFLKTQGKKRGYVERQQYEHSGQMTTFVVSDKFLPKVKKDKDCD